MVRDNSREGMNCCQQIFLLPFRCRKISNFSNVGVEILFAQVYFLLDISISRKFNLSIIALKRKDHLLLNLSLFFLLNVLGC
jgi:hypothetical protein